MIRILALMLVMAKPGLAVAGIDRVLLIGVTDYALRPRSRQYVGRARAPAIDAS